jgi:ornithine cyclodeaminase/alanine dehydrogenase-like protein (mu-crystallin family)
LIWISEADVRRLPVPAAADVIEEALGRLEISADLPRAALPVGGGQLLLMPSAVDGVGIKVLTVREGTSGPMTPRIQGIYVLMNPATLAPAAVIDGPALTCLRTPAVSIAAVRRLARPDSSRLVVFGAGPQALGHVLAVCAERPITSVTVVAPRPEAASALVAKLTAEGIASAVGSREAVAEAEIVICATTASTPVFDGRLIADEACVVAVGSHEPAKRELDAALIGRATVVVEDVATAMREAGDVVQAVREGALRAQDLVPLNALVSGPAGPRGRPRVFKSVGMAWEDLVVARHLAELANQRAGQTAEVWLRRSTGS